ncbi:hypothetical protein GCM10027605_09040 [Micromonospora zhanjiangensis]
MIKSRSATGLPSAMVVGTASAAASDTAPRKVTQPAAVRTRQPGRDEVWSSAPIGYADTSTQNSRVATTTAVTVNASTSVRSKEPPRTTRTTRGI